MVSVCHQNIAKTKNLILLLNLSNYHTTIKKKNVINSCDEYLNHCKLNKIDIFSNVFNGKLYEFHCKEILKNFFKVQNLVHCGGNNDNGIDIIGRWIYKTTVNKKNTISLLSESTGSLNNLLQNFEDTIKIDKNKKLCLKHLEKNIYIDLCVQCKNHKKKIGPAVIRELSGTYYQHKRNNDDKIQKIIFFILITSAKLTKRSIDQMNISLIPIIHLQVTRLNLSHGKETSDPYSFSNWTGGLIKSVYLNRSAKKKSVAL